MFHFPLVGLFLVAQILVGVVLPAQAVQLQNGRLLVGEVTNVTGEGLVLNRVDTGGVLQLRWDHLSAESAAELKRAFNISVEDDAEVMVEADVLTFVAPTGGVEEVIGKHVGGDGDVINIRARGLVVPVPKRTLNSWIKRPVPALSVYTKEELYLAKLAEVAPGEDADKHILLADVLVRVGDYERAEQHLKRAQDLKNSKQPQALRAKLERVKLYKEAAGERSLLDKIKTARARKDFVRGREWIKDFETKYPKSNLIPELNAEKQRFEAARERYYVARVFEACNQLVTTVAKSKCAESGVTLQAVRDYAQSGMGKEIRKRVAERLTIPATEVEELWGKRVTSGVAQGSTQFSYGVGSWVLGDREIIKGTQQAKADAAGGKQKSQQEQRDERLQRKIQEFLRRSQEAQKNAGSAPKEETDEDWWKSASPDERVNFVRSFYAENSGDMEVVSAHVSPCRTCGAEGFLAVLGSAGGDEKKIKCWTCKGTRFVRWIRAR
ncbi:MAG: hypothetical protein R3F56_02755 [Planctomycetota bacterium]